MAEKKMTNVRLDPDLWARVKAAASQRGTTLERWVSDALEAHMSPAPPRTTGMASRGRVAGDETYRDEAYRDDALGQGAAPGQHPPQPTAASAAETQDLKWRVEALEAAVDYLAGVVGGGFPRPPGHPAAGEGGGRTDG